jgi:hypothetical protein
MLGTHTASYFPFRDFQQKDFFGMVSWEIRNSVYVMMEIFNSNYQGMKGHLKIMYLVIAWKI